MSCSTCKNKTRNGLSIGSITDQSQPYPFRANDISVLEPDDNIRKVELADWPNDKHKLLILIPEAFTPVCETEVGAINHWYDQFQEQNCELIVVSVDTAHRMKDWYFDEELLHDRKFKTFSSYALPQRLGLIENGRCKRSSVFVTKDGEVVRQEHFDKVGRSFAELHRMLYGYNQDSYCAEGWQSPADGFLEKK